MDESTHRQQTLKRFEELAERARRTYAYTYTPFHSPAGAALAYQAAGEQMVMLWGGCEGCERVRVRFGDAQELGYEEDFPISVLHISPKQQKFADSLTHRDFLGAILNLGIERDVLGDIICRDNGAYVFIEEEMADYVAGLLDRVKHTAVKCVVAQELPEDARPQVAEERLTAVSIRLDSIVAKLYRLSRSDAKELFEHECVFLNGLSCRNPESAPTEGDIVSVRGYGKFRYLGEEGETKKGKLALRVGRYV